jgi:hypothetical protein
MIISASRRTDIPAFYSEWFMNRVREGYCTVPNPFNRKQISAVPLSPSEVDVIVFWTRNPKPLMSSLKDLDRMGYRYYFHFTLLGYPRLIDKFVPSLEISLANLIHLSDHIGPNRVIWRYDPIVLTPITDIPFHLKNFERISAAVEGYTHRCVISLMTGYRKTKKRLGQLGPAGAPITVQPSKSLLTELLPRINECAKAYGISISSCAEEADIASLGVSPGKCIDDAYLKKTFGLQVASTKDLGQRKACLCVASKDIGMYDSCLYGCQYCYATSSFQRAKQNYAKHDPASPSLLGRYEII